jgi:hypothetical protein
MHLCVLDHTGSIRFDRKLPCRPDALLHALEPFRDGLVVGVECETRDLLRRRTYFVRKRAEVRAYPANRSGKESERCTE